MSLSPLNSLASMSAALTQARQESLTPQRAPEAAVPAATRMPPTPAQSVRDAEYLSREAEAELASQRRMLERLQASLASLPRHDPVLGSLLDVSA